MSQLMKDCINGTKWEMGKFDVCVCAFSVCMCLYVLFLKSLLYLIKFKPSFS